MDQGRQVRPEMDATLLLPFRRQSGAAAAVRPGVQPWQFPQATGAAAECEALVTDHVAGEADQDRGEDCPSRSVRDVSDGGSGDSSQAVPSDSAANRTAENEKSVTRAGMTLCLVAESQFLKANAGTVRSQTRFAAFLGI